MARASQDLDDTVNAHTPPCRRRQAILKRSAEGLVHWLRLLITILFVCLLLCKPIALLRWIIQLLVRVHNLLAHHKQFKATSNRPSLKLMKP